MDFNINDLISTDEVIAEHFAPPKLSKVRKSGTSRSKFGAEKDRGAITHAIVGHEINGFWGGKALCGAEPGKRSNGWYPVSSKVECERCLEKIKKSIFEFYE